MCSHTFGQSLGANFAFFSEQSRYFPECEQQCLGRGGSERPHASPVEAQATQSQRPLWHHEATNLCNHEMLAHQNHHARKQNEAHIEGNNASPRAPAQCNKDLTN